LSSSSPVSAAALAQIPGSTEAFIRDQEIGSLTTRDVRFLPKEVVEYCEKNNLCPVCRAELVEVKENYEVWGSPISMKEKVCPNGD
jgi:hypothetical protein